MRRSYFAALAAFGALCCLVVVLTTRGTFDEVLRPSEGSVPGWSATAAAAFSAVQNGKIVEVNVGPQKLLAGTKFIPPNAGGSSSVSYGSSLPKSFPIPTRLYEYSGLYPLACTFGGTSGQ
eukprot:SAG31_NODE_16681_length_700_cov_0.991681_1_plen_121_part_00